MIQGMSSRHALLKSTRASASGITPLRLKLGGGSLQSAMFGWLRTSLQRLVPRAARGRAIPEEAMNATSAVTIGTEAILSWGLRALWKFCQHW